MAKEVQFLARAVVCPYFRAVVISPRYSGDLSEKNFVSWFLSPLLTTVVFVQRGLLKKLEEVNWTRACVRDMAPTALGRERG